VSEKSDRANKIDYFVEDEEEEASLIAKKRVYVAKKVVYLARKKESTSREKKSLHREKRVYIYSAYLCLRRLPFLSRSKNLSFIPVFLISPLSLRSTPSNLYPAHSTPSILYPAHSLIIMARLPGISPAALRRRRVQRTIHALHALQAPPGGQEKM
jgi:hypothetical protein